MSALKTGSLCSGAGGLDMAVEKVFGATTAWHCEINDAASKVLEYRYPGVPNHRDLTATDWDAIEPVDILTGGYPCQPFSHAGQRKGTDDERHIWPSVREAIRRLRPRYTFLENVAGHRSLGFDRVLGDLAEDGMHVRWTSLRAADVGAPHQRERLFILVTDPSRDGRALVDDGTSGTPTREGRERDATGSAWDTSATDTEGDRRDKGWPEPAGIFRRSDAALGSDAHVSLLPTPRGRDFKGATASRSGDNKHDLPSALLPTPGASDTRGQDYARARRDGSGGDDLVTTVVRADNMGQWGKYADAITRWEALTRPAPPPTEPNTKGNPRLNPAFSEWMQGWPLGWVTALVALGIISRNDALRIIGNGVVPQCAEAALRWLLSLGPNLQEAGR